MFGPPKPCVYVGLADREEGFFSPSSKQYRWKVQLVLFVVPAEEKHHEVNVESKVDFDIARVELSRYRRRFQGMP